MEVSTALYEDVQSTESMEPRDIWIPPSRSGQGRGLGIKIPSWYTWILIWYYVPILLGIPANLAAIVTFIKSPRLRRSKPVNLLIFNLAASDFISCFLAQIYIISNYTEAGRGLVSRNKYACLVVLGANQIPVQASLLSLLMLSCERLMAVFSPLHHMQYVSRKSIKVAIFFSWSFLICRGAIIFGWNTWTPGSRCVGSFVFPHEYHIFLAQVPLYLCLGLTSLFNIIIATIALRRKKAMVLRATAEVSKSDKEQTAAKLKDKKSELKVIKMLLMVVGAFYISWLPVKILGSVMKYLYGLRPPETFFITMQSIRVLNLMNLIADPVIYVSQNTQFRQAFCDLCCKRKAAKEGSMVTVISGASVLGESANSPTSLG